MRFILMCFFVATMIVTDSAFSADYEVENNGKMYLALSINSGIAVAKGSYSESWSGMPPSYYILNTPYVSGILGSIVTQYTVRIHVKTDFGGNCLYGFQNYNVITPENPEFITLPIVVDSDGDGLDNLNDPCPDTPDNYFKHYLAPNSCDGSYYFFQITGECGETKTYYNPKYSSVNEAYQDAIDNPNCSAEPEEKSVTPGQVQSFFDSHSGSTSPAGDGVILDQPVDLTGGSSSSNSTAPAEVTSTDSNTQSIIDAIKLMRDSLKSKLDDTSSDIIDRIQVDSDRIVSAIKTTSNNVTSLGTSISGVTSAVTSAGNTAHADAEALKKAIEGIEGGNASASSSGGMTSDDMRSIIEEDRNLVYTADPGINTDTGLASQGLISSIVGIVGTIQTKVQSIFPDLDVDTSSASPCISGGSITFPDGSSHAVNGLCLDSYENYFVMVGNVLYAFVCIVGVLSIFGMRRE